MAVHSLYCTHGVWLPGRRENNSKLVYHVMPLLACHGDGGRPAFSEYIAIMNGQKQLTRPHKLWPYRGDNTCMKYSVWHCCQVLYS